MTAAAQQLGTDRDDVTPALPAPRPGGITNAEGYDFIVSIASGGLDDVPAIAAVLAEQTADR